MTSSQPNLRRRLIVAVASITMYSLIGAAAALTITTITGFSSAGEEAGAIVGPRVDYGSAETNERAAITMSRVEFPWQDQLPGWTIEFVEGDSDIAGYTWSREFRIEIFVRPHSTPDSLYRVLAHEFGHAVDLSLNTGDERRGWLAQRNAEDLQWWPDSGKADFQSGAGDFAEVFAVWMTGDSSDFRSEVGPTPSPSDIELMSQLVSSD